MAPQSDPDLSVLIEALRKDPNGEPILKKIFEAVSRDYPEDQRLLAALHDLSQHFSCDYVFGIETDKDGWYILAASMVINGIIHEVIGDLNHFYTIMNHWRPLRLQEFSKHDLATEPAPRLTFDPKCPSTPGRDE